MWLIRQDSTQSMLNHLHYLAGGFYALESSNWNIYGTFNHAPSPCQDFYGSKQSQSQQILKPEIFLIKKISIKKDIARQPSSESSKDGHWMNFVFIN